MLKSSIFLVLYKSTRNYKTRSTFYDVLKLERNCTKDEIRNSYLKLSKQYHPDVNKIKHISKDSDNFIKITEAYQILIKKRTRNRYDVDLYNWEISQGHKIPGKQPKKSSTIYEPWRVKTNHDPNYNPNEYYGMKGVQKVSNMRIVAIISLFVIAGTAFEFFLIRNSFTFRREKLDDLSKEAFNQHANVRANAERYGTARQLDRMVEKMLKKKD